MWETRDPSPVRNLLAHNLNKPIASAANHGHTEVGCVLLMVRHVVNVVNLTTMQRCA